MEANEVSAIAGLFPQLASSADRVDAQLVPPSAFIAGMVGLAVVNPA
jgi:hypothetical protein